MLDTPISIILLRRWCCNILQTREARLRQAHCFTARSGGLCHTPGLWESSVLQLLWLWVQEGLDTPEGGVDPCSVTALGHHTLEPGPAACLSPRLLSLESSMPPDLPPVREGKLVSSICVPLRLPLRASDSSSEPSLPFPCHCPSLLCQPSHFLLPSSGAPQQAGRPRAQHPVLRPWQSLSLFPTPQGVWESLSVSKVIGRSP